MTFLARKNLSENYAVEGSVGADYGQGIGDSIIEKVLPDSNGLSAI